MTSKISFSKMTRDEMRKLNWLTAVQLLVFGLLIPFRTLIAVAIANSDYYRGTEVLAKDIFYENVGLGHPENTIFILIAGAVCAICVFGYVHSSVKLDFLHSLAVPRERLFAVKYLGGLLTFVTAYGLGQILALLVGAFNGAMSGRLLLEMAVATLQGILTFLCSYSCTLLAVMLTGKMLTTVLAAGVLGLYIPLVWMTASMLQMQFQPTTLERFGDNPSVLQYSSPWAFCLFQTGRTYSTHGAGEGLTGLMPGAAVLCQQLALAAILTGLALLLYRIRKTETAGSALAFKKTESIVKLMLTIPSTIVAALAANAILDSAVWEAAFIVLFGALGCMFMELIYRWDIRQALNHKLHILVTFAAAAAVFFCFRYDATGFNTYIPAKDEIAAMSVKGQEFGFTYSSKSWENGYRKDTLDQLEQKEFEPIYEMAQNGVEKVKGKLSDNYYDYYDSSAYTLIKYHLKNGKEIYRTYWVDEDLYKEKMDEMQKMESFREVYYPIMTWENTDRFVRGALSLPDSIHGKWEAEKKTENTNNTSNINNTNKSENQTEIAPMEETAEGQMEYSGDMETAEIAYGSYEIVVKKEDLGRIVEAYRKDLALVSYTDLLKSNMNFAFREEDLKTSYFNEERYPVSEKCVNTMEVLKEIYMKQ